MVPICLFTYNRLLETKKTIEALQNNFLAVESDLIIFSDGPKDNNVVNEVTSVREYLRTIKGFKSIKIITSKKNKGLANSIIEGVSKTLETHESVIVLEDDLITSPNFLDYMNQALNSYKENKNIFSVSGWSMSLNSLKNIKDDVYVLHRMSSWGWGIWKDRWQEVKWGNEFYNQFNTSFKKRWAFRQIGSDMPKMLKNYLKGKNNSWAIRACYHQFEHNMLTISPTITKVNNIGFGDNATHTKKVNRYDQILDSKSKRSFDFDIDLTPNLKIVKEFRSNFSLLARIKSKFIQ